MQGMMEQLEQAGLKPPTEIDTRAMGNALFEELMGVSGGPHAPEAAAAAAQPPLPGALEGTWQMHQLCHTTCSGLAHRLREGPLSKSEEGTCTCDDLPKLP